MKTGINNFIKAFLIITLFMLFITSCRESQSASQSPEDTLVHAIIGDIDSLDPHYAYDSASGEVLYNVYNALIGYKLGSVSEFVPELSVNVPSIEDGTIRDNGQTYEFTIRKGVKFHNGNALTASDVEYTIERALLYDPDGGPIWMFSDPMISQFRLKYAIENYTGKNWDEVFDEAEKEPKPGFEQTFVDFYHDVIDPIIEVEGDKVIIKLQKAFPPFLNVMAEYSSWAMIIDKEWSIESGLWDGNPGNWWKYYNLRKEDSPMYAVSNGTGPYKVAEVDRSQNKIILERNDDYWMEPAAVRRVVIHGIAEWSTRKAMFEKGDAQILYTPPEYKEQARSIPGSVINENYPSLGVNSAQFLWNINDDSKYIGSGKLDGEGIPTTFFSDKDVRLGFIYAFDNDTFINEVINNNGFTPPTVLIKGLLGYNPDIPVRKFNIEKAREHFKKAYNGKLWNIGFKMIITYNTGNDTRRNVAELLSAGIKTVNPKFNVEAKGVEWPTFLDARKNGSLPLLIIGWNADYPDPNNFIFTYYHSDGDYGSAYGESFDEFVKLSRDEFDGMSFNDYILKASLLTDNDGRVKMYDVIQKFAIEEGIGMPLVQLYASNVLHESVKGWVSNPMHSINTFDYYQLSLEN